MIRVLLAEDQHLIRGALAALLMLEGDIQVVAEVGRGDEIVPAALAARPDVAVLDIELPGIDGLEAAEQLWQELPDCGVLVLTGYGRPGNLRRALQAHVRGFLVKDAPAARLADALRRVARGERVVDPELVAAALEAGDNPLSPREVAVLRETAAGASADEVARRLHLSPGTVRNYLSNAMSKVGARNRLDAIRIARDTGWLDV